MLLAIDRHEDLIKVESVAIALMSAYQSTDVFDSKLDAPKSDGLMADSDATFGQEIFASPVAEIEFIVEPNSVTDDIWRESMALEGIHHRIINEGQLS